MQDRQAEQLRPLSSPLAWPRQRHVWFAGVAFRFSCEPAFDGDSLPPEAHTGLVDLPTVASVGVHPAATELERRLPRTAVRWRWDGERASLCGGHIPASLVREAQGRYESTGPGTRDAQDLLTCLASPALQREGGLLLHACAVEYRGGALLFVGPSGAGKSTAAMHLPGARLLARDVSALFPVQGRWWVAAMPGGTEPERPIPPSAKRCLPLRGVLRVRKATHGPSIDDCQGMEAMATVLGAVRHACVSTEDHERMLDSVSEIAQVARVSRLNSVLGCELTDCVVDWLGTEDGH